MLANGPADGEYGYQLPAIETAAVGFFVAGEEVTVRIGINAPKDVCT